MDCFFMTGAGVSIPIQQNGESTHMYKSNQIHGHGLLECKPTPNPVNQTRLEKV